MKATIKEYSISCSLINFYKYMKIGIAKFKRVFSELFSYGNSPFVTYAPSITAPDVILYLYVLSIAFADGKLYADTRRIPKLFPEPLRFSDISTVGT